MQNLYKNAYRSALVALLWAGLLILVEWLEPAGGWQGWGVYPRYMPGLKGILTYPFLHGDPVDHLLSNLGSLIPLAFAVHFFYPKLFWKVVAGVHIFSGIWVWVAARPSWHIGASGVIFGLAFFLIASGWFRRKWDLGASAIGLLAIFFNGSVFFGVLPWFNPPNVSWEGHLFGALAGILMAWIYRKKQLPPPPPPPNRYSPDIPDEFWDYQNHQPPPEGMKHV
jgi:membrane associated rhomboid family serine protease